MKYEKALILSEEGGTIKTDNGHRMYNVTKQRRRRISEISKEMMKLEKEIKKLSEENSENKIKLIKLKLKALTKEKQKIAVGNSHEYVINGKGINGDESYRVDAYDGSKPERGNDPKASRNWANRLRKEKEISDRLNNQNSNKKFVPR